MSGEMVPTSIRILDKEYVVSCPPGEQESLQASAAFLNERMLQAREGGNIIGTERIAVMAALNVVHDYLNLLRNSEEQETSLASSIGRLSDKLGATIASTRTSG